MADEQPKGSGSEQQFGKYFAKLGIQFDQDQLSNIKKQLTPIEGVLKSFGKSAAFKDSWFSKLPSISSDTQKVNRSTHLFLKTLLATGKASKEGADGGKFYNEQLGFMGKSFVNLVGAFMRGTEGVDTFTFAVEGAEIAITGGLILAVLAVIKVFQLLSSVVTGAMKVQDTLNSYNKLLGGQSIAAQRKFNTQLNETIAATTKYGFELGTVLQSMTAYIQHGLAPQIATNAKLIETTGMLSKVTGESTDTIASMFSSLILGSRATVSQLETMSNQFTAFNKSIEETGSIIGPISMNKLKEAIDSTGTAFIIATSKGDSFVKKLTNDLIGLSALTQSLGISVSEINSKFEEASNLILNSSSKFRGLLAISGAADINNMLTNQFNRTDATLKVIKELKSLNDQFGGNLNIMGQVAQEAFGVNKDTAIKLAQTSQAQIDSLQRIQDFSNKVMNKSLKDSYDSVRSTLSESWEKLKAVFQSFMYRIMSNPALQEALTRIGHTISSFAESLGDKNSVLGKLTDLLSNWLTKGADWINNHIIPYLEEFQKWVSSMISSKGSIWDTLKNMLMETAIAMGTMFAKGAMLILYEAFKHSPIGWMMNSSALSEWKQSETDKKNEQEAQHLRLQYSSFLQNQLNGLQSEISKAQLEKSRLAGLQDSDVVLNKEGKWTFAGLERQSLDKEINKVNTDLAAKTKENTDALNKLTAAISGKSKEEADRIAYQMTGGKVGVPTPKSAVNQVSFYNLPNTDVTPGIKIF